MFFLFLLQKSPLALPQSRRTRSTWHTPFYASLLHLCLINMDWQQSNYITMKRHTAKLQPSLLETPSNTETRILGQTICIWTKSLLQLRTEVSFWVNNVFFQGTTTKITSITTYFSKFTLHLQDRKWNMYKPARICQHFWVPPEQNPFKELVLAWLQFLKLRLPLKYTQCSNNLLPDLK